MFQWSISIQGGKGSAVLPVERGYYDMAVKAFSLKNIGQETSMVHLEVERDLANSQHHTYITDTEKPEVSKVAYTARSFVPEQQDKITVVYSRNDLDYRTMDFQRAFKLYLQCVDQSGNLLPDAKGVCLLDVHKTQHRQFPAKHQLHKDHHTGYHFRTEDEYEN